MKKEITAMRIAGIACVIMLAAIGVFTFTTPSDEFVTYLALLGSLVGGKTTMGVFMLAALPPLTALIAYYVWKWLPHFTLITKQTPTQQWQNFIFITPQ